MKFTIIDNPYKDADILLGYKGSNTIITEENCEELCGWTKEEYRKYTVNCPYIPEFPVSIVPQESVQRKQLR